MNARLATAILLLASLFSVSCAATGERPTRVKAIGYVSLSSLFDFAVTRDPEASKLRKKKQGLIASRKSVDARTGKDRMMIDKIDAELESISEREEYYRARILTRINNAVRRVARRRGMDFILNIGDHVVYARKKYDLTEDVIKEMIQLEKRSEPVSR